MKLADKYKLIAKQKIAEIFYDKDIEVWKSGILKDDEGSITGSGKVEIIEKFMGNFLIKTKEKIKQEYGEEIEANGIVTCDKTIANEKDILVYNNEDYEIVSVLPLDSHTKLLVYGSDTNE